MNNYQAIFTDFDYDYIALGQQLGSKWIDNTWKNNSCPSYATVLNAATDHETWYTLWFDYADKEMSEFGSNRFNGSMKKFELTDELGDYLFQTDDWEEMKQAIENNIVQKHYDNKQEKRATDND